MTAYLHVQVTVTHPEKFKEYAQQAGPTMVAYGAQFPSRLSLVEPLTGETHAKVVAIVEFESVQKIKDWYGSAEYQKLIPLRDEGADVNLAIYE